MALNNRMIDLKRLFFFAVESGDVDAVGRLIDDYGVDRSVQNSEGLRAIKIAEAAEDEAMMRLLSAAPTMYVGVGGDMDRREGETEIQAREIRFMPFRSRPVEL